MSPRTAAGRGLLEELYLTEFDDDDAAAAIVAIELEVRDDLVEKVWGLTHSGSVWTGRRESPLVHRDDVLALLGVVR